MLRWHVDGRGKRGAWFWLTQPPDYNCFQSLAYYLDCIWYELCYKQPRLHEEIKAHLAVPCKNSVAGNAWPKKVKKHAKGHMHTCYTMIYSHCNIFHPVWIEIMKDIKYVSPCLFLCWSVLSVFLTGIIIIKTQIKTTN